MQVPQALSLAVLLCCGAAHASVVDVSIPTGVESQTFMNYHAASLLAQTFTAGFAQSLDAVTLHNDHWAGSTFQPLTVSVEKTTAEDAPGGAILGSLTVNAAYGFQRIDLSSLGIQLEQGQHYALVLGSTYSGNLDYANAVEINPGYKPAYGPDTPNAYPEGMLWMTSNGVWTPYTDVSSQNIPGLADLVFTTYGTPTAVPEPADVTLFMLGLGLMAAKVRSRRL
ncbi:MAG: PEP-CTERM sorting domain-containing protein [Aquabacterium sp.]|uniref:PEP-CTERM sorting domain-containing protein n=1 Tax=Aquabacterium sp. TaxID=1872578 RepID=UPI00121159CB|nr:PEP-CTERM sorting domain-containing protein [Aquabacterium sp.]TAK91165.1 MAG: PEP-CTERM sorting domain-containing protein [Aquabacterium sp.]